MNTTSATDAHTTPHIVVYSSPTCAYCHLAMEYFDQLGFSYEEKDVSVDQDALKFILEKVGQAVTPVITIDETVIVGFDREKINKTLNINPER